MLVGRLAAGVWGLHRSSPLAPEALSPSGQPLDVKYYIEVSIGISNDDDNIYHVIMISVFTYLWCHGAP